MGNLGPTVKRWPSPPPNMGSRCRRGSRMIPIRRAGAAATRWASPTRCAARPMCPSTIPIMRVRRSVLVWLRLSWSPHRQWRDLLGQCHHGRPSDSAAPSYVRVTNRDNGRSLIVRVNDRGPMSRAASSTSVTALRPCWATSIAVRPMCRSNMSALHPRGR